MCVHAYACIHYSDTHPIWLRTKCRSYVYPRKVKRTNEFYFLNLIFRKRSREDDLPCESTPLSKRINNLNISYDDGNSSSSSSCSISGLINDNNNYLIPTINAGCGGGPAEVIGGGYEYNPELNADQNPYYYEKNKMLYDLHVERVKRNSH